MESESGFPRVGRPQTSPGEAHKLLHDLDADRAALAGRIAAPWWLYPAFAVLVALYVASPAIEHDDIRGLLVWLAIILSVLLVLGYQRISGVRVSRTGVRGTVILGAFTCSVLVLVSISFGLASFAQSAWIAIPTVVGFVLAVILGRRFDRVYREELRRGR